MNHRANGPKLPSRPSWTSSWSDPKFQWAISHPFYDGFGWFLVYKELYAGPTWCRKRQDWNTRELVENWSSSGTCRKLPGSEVARFSVSHDEFWCPKSCKTSLLIHAFKRMTIFFRPPTTFASYLSRLAKSAFFTMSDLDDPSTVLAETS